MTGYAFVCLDFQRMRVMAGDAGVIAFHVGKLGIIHLARILIAALCLFAVQGCCCGKVVDVAECAPGSTIKQIVPSHQAVCL